MVKANGLFIFLSRYFWLLALLAASFNAGLFGRTAKKFIKPDPSLAPGYVRLQRGYLFWLSLPWIIMGLGGTIGGIPSVWYYFRPCDGNPYVLAWFGAIIIEWIIGTAWLFFRKGAETLAKYPGIFTIYYKGKRQAIQDPVIIKILWVAALAAGITAFSLLWTVNIPLPDLCLGN
jgi:hypothetical protein